MLKILVLCWVTCLADSFGAVHIACKNRSGMLWSSFEEGIDAYLLTFNDPHRTESFSGKLLGTSGPGDVVLQVRIPKVFRDPELTPGCFFASAKPLLFTCPERPLTEKVRILEIDGVPSTREVAVDRFNMRARRVKLEGPDAKDQYIWRYEAVAKGKDFLAEYRYEVTDCRGDGK